MSFLGKWFLNANYSSGGGYSAEYEAVLTRAVAEGFDQPDPNISALIDTLLIQPAVEDGSFATFDRFFFPAINSLGLTNFSRISFKNPLTANLAGLTGITYGAGGWKGNGTTGYVDTGFNPVTDGVNYTQNSASRSIWVRTAPTVGDALDGIATGNQNRIISSSANTHRINQELGLLNVVVDLSGTGYKALNRSSSTNVEGYNGAVKTSATATSAAMISANQLILNRSGSLSNAEIAAYVIGGSRSEIQHNNLATNIAAFLSAVGL